MTPSTLFESLESRQLLSGTPSLSGVLSFNKTIIALPGQQIKATLKITNSGETLAKTPVSIGIYISRLADLSGAQKITASPVSLAIKAGKTKNVPLKISLPSDIDEGGFFILTNINDDGQLAEASGANGVSSAPLFDPAGLSYAAHYTGTNAAADLNVSISQSADGKLLADVSTNGGDLGDIELDNLKSTVSSSGTFSIKGSGADPANGISHLSLSLNGKLDRSTGTINGKASFNGKNANGAFHGHGTFSMSPIAD